MSTAVGADAFRDYARMAGVELLVIDESTTATEFENELRWNAAYYRLAGGVLAQLPGRRVVAQRRVPLAYPGHRRALVRLRRPGRPVRQDSRIRAAANRR